MSPSTASGSASPTWTTTFSQPMTSLQLKGFSVESHSDLAVPEVYASQVVHLSAGKLCVAKLFAVDHKERGEINFAMLTGVEVVRSRVGKLRIIKHKSCRCNFDKDYTPGASSCRRAAAFFALADRIHSTPTSRPNPISRLGTIPNRSGILEEKKMKKGFGKTKNR
uniref:Uncharacterized protein n=1 Tax=Oryza punctata TaxID=4537 RepID=A0A0E0JVF8_ORYPU